LNFDKFKELLYGESMFKCVYEPLENHLQPGKVLLIYGPRRVGKTTLLQNFLAQTSLKYKLDSGDNIRTQQILTPLQKPFLTTKDTKVTNFFEIILRRISRF